MTITFSLFFHQRSFVWPFHGSLAKSLGLQMGSWHSGLTKWAELVMLFIPTLHASPIRLYSWSMNSGKFVRLLFQLSWFPSAQPQSSTAGIIPRPSDGIRLWTYYYDDLHLLSFSQNEIFCTAYLAAIYLRNILNFQGKAYLIGSPGMQEEFKLFDINYTGTGVSGNILKYFQQLHFPPFRFCIYVVTLNKYIHARA